MTQRWILSGVFFFFFLFVFTLDAALASEFTRQRNGRTIQDGTGECLLSWILISLIGCLSAAEIQMIQHQQPPHLASTELYFEGRCSV